MDADERTRLAEALLDAAQALVAIAVRSVAAGPAALTVVQHRVLVLLDTRGSLSVTALAEALGVDQSNASRHCTRLEALGLVRRARSPHDGRAVDLTLRAAGRLQVEAVRQARRREITQVLEGMPDDAVVSAVRFLEEFDRAAGALPDPSIQVL